MVYALMNIIIIFYARESGDLQTKNDQQFLYTVKSLYHVYMFRTF